VPVNRVMAAIERVLRESGGTAAPHFGKAEPYLTEGGKAVKS
jgi:hypothetical protein